MNSDKHNQVSLSGAAHARPAASGKRKKKPFPLWIIPVAVAVLVVVLLVVSLLPSGEKGPTVSSREMVEYTYTADSLCDEMTYCIIGVTGEDPEATMDAVGLLCFDRKNETLTLLQMPVSTYIGNDGTYAAVTIGNVWGNPAPMDWCGTCRIKVKAEEKNGGKHSTCGTELETRKGSAFSDLARVFNTQYGLPVDNYLIIPRTGLATLVDSLGGVDMVLPKNYKLADVDYEKGTRVLSGAAAVDYVFDTEYTGSAETDMVRLERQRVLLAALLERFSGYKVGQLYNDDPNRSDILSATMLGEAPIRMDTGSFGKARLMGSSSDSSADDVKFCRALAEFIHDASQVSLENVTCCVLPGASAKKGTTAVYSPYPAVIRSMLNDKMNPGGLTIDDKTAVMFTVGNERTVTPTMISLNTVRVEQTSTLTPPTDSLTTEEAPAEE